MVAKPADVTFGNEICVQSNLRKGKLDESDDELPALMLALNISDSGSQNNEATNKQTKNRPSIETNRTESNKSSSVGDPNFTLSEDSLQSLDMPLRNLQDTNLQMDCSMLDCDISITRG